MVLPGGMSSERPRYSSPPQGLWSLTHSVHYKYVSQTQSPIAFKFAPLPFIAVDQVSQRTVKCTEQMAHHFFYFLHNLISPLLSEVLHFSAIIIMPEY